MNTKHHITHKIRSKAVRDARAGLIPASDDLCDENRERVKLMMRVTRSLKASVNLGKEASEDLVIPEALAALRLYCKCTGISFEKLNKAGKRLFLAEEEETSSAGPI